MGLGSSFGIGAETGNNIVTDGLIFYIDPAYKISYPGHGSTFNIITTLFILLPMLHLIQVVILSFDLMVIELILLRIQILILELVNQYTWNVWIQMIRWFL